MIIKKSAGTFVTGFIEFNEKGESKAIPFPNRIMIEPPYTQQLIIISDPDDEQPGESIYEMQRVYEAE